MNLNFLKNIATILLLCMISGMSLSACGKDHTNVKKDNFVNETKKAEAQNTESSDEKDDCMKLQSSQHSVVENEISEDLSTENVSIDATKGSVTLTGTLEYRCTESSANPDVMKELYILHLDQEISELIYFDYDSEKNETAEGITEIDVIGDAELLEGWVHDGKRVTITGEIIPNYTMYFFNSFSIIQEQLEFH